MYGSFIVIWPKIRADLSNFRSVVANSGVSLCHDLNSYAWQAAANNMDVTVIHLSRLGCESRPPSHAPIILNTVNSCICFPSNDGKLYKKWISLVILHSKTNKLTLILVCTIVHFLYLSTRKSPRIIFSEKVNSSTELRVFLSYPVKVS